MAKHERQREDGIFIGNQLDKGAVRNPIGRAMVRQFDACLLKAAVSAAPTTIHEVGCGEARLSRLLSERLKVPLLGTDFSEALIKENQRWAHERLVFERRSIYDLDPVVHRRDLVVCCEVLEHLEQPDRGLGALHSLGARAYLLSVPREPIWRAMNVARGKYWGAWGNTPGHLNHWSRGSFARFLANGGFEVSQWLNPFPWLMALVRPAD